VRRLGKVRGNPPIEVRTFGGTSGHRVSREVLAVEYRHEHSAKKTPFRHDFDQTGIEMWANADGSITLRHPRLRLWDDFITEDKD
jgi:hypothetical protein